MQNDQNYNYRQQQQDQGSANIPPRGYEAQLQNPRYNNKGQQDWMKDNLDPKDNQQGPSAANLDYLQKEFLRQEYTKQQDELRKKKEETVKQKESEFAGQMELKRQIEYENAQEKQLAADKKRALGELYRVQIEQANIEKQRKKQSLIDEDKYRLQQQFEIGNQNGARARNQREDQRKDLINQINANPNYPNGSQNKQQQQDNLEKGDSLMNQIGRGDDKRRQQIERFENVQAVNNRNFVSYDDEKSKKAEAFTNVGSRAVFSNDTQYSEKGRPGFQGDNDKRDYNEALKRQMAEKWNQKEVEKNERQRPYDQPSYGQQKQPQYEQQIEQPRKPSYQQQQQQQEYDIMGQPKAGGAGGYSDSQSSSSAAQKREDQQRYRSMLDAQKEQIRLLKDSEPGNSKQPSRGSNQVVGQEYDIMGNLKNVYQGNNADTKSVQAQKNRDDQQKYREFLQLQQQQNKQAKDLEDDEVADLERRLNENARISDNDNYPRQSPATNVKVAYNPITNAVSANRGNNNRGGDENSQGGQRAFLKNNIY